MSQIKSREKSSSVALPLVLSLGGACLLVVVILGLVILGVFMGGSRGTAAEVCGPDSPGYVGPETDTSVSVPGALRAQQISNAKIIDQTAENLGLSGTASKIAIIAAMGESSLINIDYGDEAQGVTNPDGSATRSKGLFQQQTPWWGTVEQIMNPEYSTTSFLLGADHKGTTQGLVTIPGWDTGEITQIIHKVQANADPNHYAASYAPAGQVITEAGIDVTRAADETKQGAWHTVTEGAAPGSNTEQPANQGCGAGGNAPGTPGKSTQEGNSYPWDALAPAPGVYVVDPLSFYYGECTSYAAWKVNEAMGGTATNIVFDNHTGGHIKGNGGQWRTAWEALGWQVSNTPKVDSVAFWAPYGGAGIGEAGHVGWVDEITADGKVIISEYNNSYYGPPGHEYSRRPIAIDASEVNAYLYVPERN